MFYDPLSEFERLFDNAFSARFQTPVTPRETYTTIQPPNPFRPRMDLFEVKDTNTVTAVFELPGLKSDDVAIDIQQNRLTISGEANRHAQEGGYAVQERQHGKFTRTLQLPAGTKAEYIKAKMENGLLTVSFPKVSPEQQPRRISVQTA